MSKIFEFLRDYIAIIAALGVTVTQLLNVRPAEQSLPAFAIFSLLVVVALAYWVWVIVERRPVRRGAEFVREPVHSRRNRRLAAAGLALAPPLYVVLAVAFHVPNTWPILIRAGAELRAANERIMALRGHALLPGLDEEVEALFVPDEGFVADRRAIRHITIYNRSTVPSPPLELRISLRAQPGASDPLARVFAAAVASPAERNWLPIGGAPAATRWLPSTARCGQREDAWCFVHPPDDRRNWLEPTVRLPSIPPRDSVEIYLEMALATGAPFKTIPADLTLTQAAEGRFLVNLRTTVDLNAGLR